MFALSVDELHTIFDEGSSPANEIQKLGGPEAIANKLGSNLETGIKTSSIPDRQNVFGKNVHKEPPFKSFIGLLIDALGDTTLIILIISAFISLSLGLLVSDPDKNSDGIDDKNTGWIEGTAILIAVITVSMVAAGNDYSKEKQFRKLNQVKENKNVRVIRDGHPTTIGSFDLVVGDIVVLDTGDPIAGDGIMVQSFNLSIDQSAVTGESVPSYKDVNNPILLAGCSAVEGVGKMIVLRVGPNSLWGKTVELLTTEEEETPLQIKLEKVAATIGWIGLGAAILIFVAQMCHWVYDIYYNPETSSDPFERLAEVVGFIINSITIVVVAVPEGLPLAVTISLAYSMQKMMKDNNLVRKLEACETMGGATDICSDKTGTLTQNKMTVVDLYLAGERIKGLESLNSETPKLSKKLVTLLCDNISINSTAHISVEGSFQGNPTECALLLFTQKYFDFDYISIRGAAKILHLFTFSSATKRMSAIVDLGNGKCRVYTKGAPEIVFESCSSLLDSKGNVQEKKAETIKATMSTVHEMASTGLRVLALAYKDYDINQVNQIIEEQGNFKQDFTLISIVGIQDPPRPETKDAVNQCQKAGLFVRMVTGDNKDTADAIAREVGILSDGISMEGYQFRQLSEEKMNEILPRLQVLARSTPNDKHLLVTALKKLNRVVCVTGDGTNDAPALRSADVGMSMGICGTDVAKEASDIVLLDDNFASIVKSIAWGRCVYDNIRKFLQFQLTVNLVALTTAFFAALCEYGTPLTAVQLLWVNLIMDTLAALALATEPPSPDALERKPYGKNENIVSKTMWRNIIFQALFQLVVQYLVLVHAPGYFGITPQSRLHNTLSFNVFVFCQIFNEFNSRRINSENDIFTGLFDNGMFVAIIAITFVVQVLFIQFGGSFTQTVPLPLNLWVASILVASLSIPFGFVYRLIPVEASAIKKVKRD